MDAESSITTEQEIRSLREKLERAEEEVRQRDDKLRQQQDQLEYALDQVQRQDRAMIAIREEMEQTGEQNASLLREREARTGQQYTSPGVVLEISEAANESLRAQNKKLIILAEKLSTENERLVKLNVGWQRWYEAECRAPPPPPSSTPPPLPPTAPAAASPAPTGIDMEVDETADRVAELDLIQQAEPPGSTAAANDSDSDDMEIE